MRPIMYTLHVNSQRELIRVSKQEARKAAQQISNHLQCWVDVWDEYDRFIFNISPQHQCNHCKKWS